MKVSAKQKHWLSTFWQAGERSFINLKNAKSKLYEIWTKKIEFWIRSTEEVHESKKDLEKGKWGSTQKETIVRWRLRRKSGCSKNSIKSKIQNKISC